MYFCRPRQRAQPQPSDAHPPPTVWTVVSLIGGCVAMISAGTLYSFSVWGPALLTKGFTLSDVNIVAAVGQVGNALSSLPLSLLLERCGPFWGMLIGVFCLAFGYIMIWLQLVQLIPAQLVGVILAYFVVGVGSRATYCSDLNSNIQNWDLHQRGRVVGLNVTLLGLSSAIFTGIYAGALRGTYGPPSSVLLFAICTGSTALVGAVTISVPRSFPTIHHQADAAPDYAISKEALVEPWRPLKVIRTWNFWLLIVVHMFGSASGLIFINSVGSFYIALGGVQGEQTSAVIITSVGNAIGRIVTGLCSDLLLHKLPRAFWLQMNVVVMMVGFALCLAATTPAWVMGASIVMGFSYGGLVGLMPTVVSDLYGAKYFGRNFGIVDMSNPLACKRFQNTTSIFPNVDISPNSQILHGGKRYLPLSTYTLRRGLLFASVLIAIDMFG
jgi:OFA family oxalate/formate antiporter-like MFS transporter